MKKIKYDDLRSPFMCSQTYPSNIFFKYIDNGFFPKASRNLTFAPHNFSCSPWDGHEGGRRSLLGLQRVEGMLLGYHACCKQLHVRVGATRSLLWYHQLQECEIVLPFKKRRFGSLSWDVETRCCGKIYCRHLALLADASVYPLAHPVRDKSTEREHSFHASVK